MAVILNACVTLSKWIEKSNNDRDDITFVEKDYQQDTGECACPHHEAFTKPYEKNGQKPASFHP